MTCWKDSIIGWTSALHITAGHPDPGPMGNREVLHFLVFFSFFFIIEMFSMHMHILPNNCIKMIVKELYMFFFVGSWRAQSIQHASLDLGVTSESPRLGVELT